MKTKTKKTAEQSGDLARRIHLMGEKWRGDAAGLELGGADAYDPQVATLHNCARDLGRLMPKEV